jgi:lipopolysaccharide export system permease protein
LIREYIVPVSDRYANTFRAQKIEADPAFNLIRSDRGLWLRENNQFIHLNYVSGKGEIFGFARFAFDAKGELQFAQYAPHAVHVSDTAQRGWQLEKPKTTVFGDNQVVAGAQEDFWQSELVPNLLSVVAIDSDELSLRELRSYIRYLDEQHQDARIAKLSFWKRALQPLAMIGLVLIAVSFIFGSLRETTMGYRLFFGVMLGMAFRFSQSILGPTSIVYGFAPWVAIALPIVICWGLGFFLLSRVK